jgi:hypothetical protein
MRISWWLYPGLHETERMQPDHHPGPERVGRHGADPRGGSPGPTVDGSVAFRPDRRRMLRLAARKCISTDPRSPLHA